MHVCVYIYIYAIRVIVQLNGSKYLQIKGHTLLFTVFLLPPEYYVLVEVVGKLIQLYLVHDIQEPKGSWEMCSHYQGPLLNTTLLPRHSLSSDLSVTRTKGLFDPIQRLS